MAADAPFTALDVSRKGLPALAPWLAGSCAPPALAGLHTLDASRNCLRTTEGLQALGALRGVSVYYNRVDGLHGLAPLAACPHLRVLDARLNPVCRTSNYRVCVMGGGWRA